MRRSLLPFVMLATAWGLNPATGQDQPAPAPPATPAWQAQEIAAIEGFAVPECVAPFAEGGVAFVSSIDSEPDHYGDDDGKGFISTLSPAGELKELRWLDSAPEAVLNGPKGMCLLEGFLYFTDNTRLMRYPVDGNGPLVEVPLPHTKMLNDLATDGTWVYASDTALGLVYKVGKNGGQTIIKAPPSVNGLVCRFGKLFAVSWDLHEIYELDPAGVRDPEPFGLAAHFTNLDGIEILDDGSFLVSDFMSNKLCVVSPNRAEVATLVETDSPADVGYDRTRKLVYVPQFMKNRVVIYQLSKNE